MKKVTVFRQGSGRVVVFCCLLVVLFFKCTGGAKKDTETGKESLSGAVSGDSIYTAKTYKEKAHYVYRVISKYYSVPNSDFFNESYPRQKEDKEVAYMWPASGMVTGVGILRQLKISDSTFNRVDRCIDKYWSINKPLQGVESYPPSLGGGTRFYDDNATVGLDYLENYKATGDAHYLQQAKKCMAFDFTGESTECGGGIYWNEDGKIPSSKDYFKATCASGFATTLALKLYLITHESKYLEFAKRVYGWMKSKVQDPADHICWDAIAIADNCSPSPDKWDYNSGAMMSNAVMLYKVTNKKQYYDDAKELSEATFKFFTQPSDTLGRRFPDHDSWFTTVLFRAYLDFYEIDKNKNREYIETIIKNVDYAWFHARNSIGLFYEDWSGRKVGRDYWLLNQACMVEMYGRIAIYKGE